MRLPMNTSLATLKPSGIRRINALAAQYPGCIALALGEPDFSTPDMISAEVTASLDRGDTHYPPNNGRPALREALSAYMGGAGLAFFRRRGHPDRRRDRGPVGNIHGYAQPRRRGHYPHASLWPVREHRRGQPRQSGLFGYRACAISD